MAKSKETTVGIMDPNSLSFPEAIEGLFEKLNLHIKYEGTEHSVSTRRIKCRPYNTLAANTSCSAILNRGAHWNPHHNSFFTLVAHKVYLLNDMNSFKAIDKNIGYGQMAELGMKIPKTWAIPQQDYSGFEKADRVNTELIFRDHELFSLEEIGEQVGYPAFLKPQDGGGWVGVERVKNPQELVDAYNKSGARPQNLQEAIEYREFVRTVGVGPQLLPMHYNADAEFSHDRYLRNENQAVDPAFLSTEEFKEVSQLCKIVNAFYKWDHNSCECLIDNAGNVRPIDFANAYPDSTVISLHYYFPDLVKAMVRWLTFCSVTGRVKPVPYAYDWRDYFEIKNRAEKEGMSYHELLDEYEKLADKYYDTEKFNAFCAEHLKDFDEIAVEYFESDDYARILEAEVVNYFTLAHEQPAKFAHYNGIHSFWCHCERERMQG